MKRFALLLALGTVFFDEDQASAQSVSIAASPTSQTVAAGHSFNVSFTLSVPQGSGPANVTAYDFYLVTAAANSGYFSITAANSTGPFNTFGPDDSNGDPLVNATGSGYVRNGTDQGFSGPTQNAPFNNLALETLTLTIAANTPANTYTFQTSTMSTAGIYYSDVSDSTGRVYEVTSPGMFSVTVVPEPSALMVLGGGLLVRGLWSIGLRRCTIGSVPSNRRKRGNIAS